MKPLIFRIFDTIAYHNDAVVIPEGQQLAPNSEPDPITGLRTYYKLGVARINIDTVVSWEINVLLTEQLGMPVTDLVTSRRTYQIPYTIETVSAAFGAPISFD